jgi:adenylosuccinate lyase
VTLAWSAHQVGSSTMPHKRNPEACEQVVAVARLAKAQVVLALDGMILEHERDYRGTRLEWCSVTDVSHYTLAAFETLIDVVEGMMVNTDRLRQNAEQAAEAICTEALVFRLAEKFGKESAYRIVYDLSQKSQNEKTSLRALIEANPSLVERLGEGVFDPSQHLGSCDALIDRVLAAVKESCG